MLPKAMWLISGRSKGETQGLPCDLESSSDYNSLCGMPSELEKVEREELWTGISVSFTA